MDIKQALRDEIEEREVELRQLQLALSALEDNHHKPHKRPKSVKRGGPITEAGRRKLSRLMKARWASRRNGKGTLPNTKSAKKFVHWTKRPENKHRLAAHLKKMRKAYKNKLKKLPHNVRAFPKAA